ncbi:MAG TPA: nitronate monooxygenase [Dehalococcoidia bacterium]|nr:nitronate monooxygenase [Dehalococcoidia bacterium]
MSRVVLRTRLCELLGIEYPVIGAGMGPVAGGDAPVATADLTAAVSNAGGLGVIGGSGYGPARLREEIENVRSMTDRPFGVDLLLPANYMGGHSGTEDPRSLIPEETRKAVRGLLESLNVEWKEAPAQPTTQAHKQSGMSDEQMEVVIEEKIPVFASGLGNPGPWVDRLKANGTKILSLVGNVKAARRVAEAGVDVVVAQGTEAGGHTGRIATIALVPQVIDAVHPTPVVAAGGIADGRGLAAALALGALGAWCGTAFLVADEANQPELQKRRILAAIDEDTRVTRLYSGKTMRNITNPLVEIFESSSIEALPMGIHGLLVADVIHSCRAAGREDLLMNAAGQISGMLSAGRPAGEILDGMVGGAAEIIGKQLPEIIGESAGVSG